MSTFVSDSQVKRCAEGKIHSFACQRAHLSLYYAQSFTKGESHGNRSRYDPQEGDRGLYDCT
jgi:hypothetical protein